MSVIHRGQVFETPMSIRSNGGTEQMRKHLLSLNLNLKDLTIFCSRIWGDHSRYLEGSSRKVFWFHDLPGDPAMGPLIENLDKFEALVFVSNDQKRRFELAYPEMLSVDRIVIPNFAHPPVFPTKTEYDGYVRFIYHTTPHRGLREAIAIIDRLAFDGYPVTLDVFSSFGTYGMPEMDEKFRGLFDHMKKYPSRYIVHGYKPHHQLLPVLRACDAFLYPSTWIETSCLSMMESFVNGTPVIYTDTGALSETAAGFGFKAKTFEECLAHARMVCDVVESTKVRLTCNGTRWLATNGGEPRFKKQWQSLIGG